MVPKAQEPVALIFDEQRSFGIARGFVLSAIRFNDETGAMGSKVSDEVTDGNLTAEMRLRKVFAQEPPEALLGFSWIPSEPTRSRGGALRWTILDHPDGLLGSPHP